MRLPSGILSPHWAGPSPALSLSLSLSAATRRHARRRIVGMKRSLPLLCAALFPPCDSLPDLPFVPHVHSGAFCFSLAVVAVVLLASCCYVFHPAYANAGGGLGHSVALVAGGGDGGDGEQDALLSLVIPAYNEEERLPAMLDATLAYLETHRRDVTECASQLLRDAGWERATVSRLGRFEFIVVDDGSSDNTESVVKKYAEKIANGDTLKLASMHKNCGKGGAVKTGMLQSSGQLCLMVDADGATDIGDGLQKSLKHMTRLVAEHRRGDAARLPPAAVFGSRAHLEEASRASRSGVRTFLMRAFHFFVKALCSPNIRDTQCGFKLFTRPAVALLFGNLHLRHWAFDTELVVIAEKLNVPLSEVGVIWHEIDGSKLDVGKIALATASLGMLRDMICVRACYFLGIWKLKR